MNNFTVFSSSFLPCLQSVYFRVHVRQRRSPTVCTSQRSWTLRRSWPANGLPPRRWAGSLAPASSPAPARPCTWCCCCRCRCCRRPASQSWPPSPYCSSSAWPRRPGGSWRPPWRRSPWSRRSSRRSAARSTKTRWSSWCPSGPSSWCPTGGNRLERPRGRI